MEDTFNTNEVLREIVDEIKPIAEDKGVIMNEEISQDYRLKGANRSLIFSMFSNVINNAIKNTSSGGHVTIKSFISGNYFNVTISDTGCGMSKEQIDKLFSRFKAKVNSQEDGTGIGLAIAKTIADFHRIVVSVTSEVEKGTSFSFIFPENS